MVNIQLTLLKDLIKRREKLENSRSNSLLPPARRLCRPVDDVLDPLAWLVVGGVAPNEAAQLDLTALRVAYPHLRWLVPVIVHVPVETKRYYITPHVFAVG